MITQLKIPVTTLDKIRISADFAYNLYGAWMEALEPEQADFIHEAHAMNQYLTNKVNEPNAAVLTVNLLTEDAVGCMLPLLKGMHQYHLTKHNCALIAQEPQVYEITEEDLVNSYYTSPQYQKRITLHLVTPTTFKTNNHYAVFPSPELIIQSAVSKWNMLNLNVAVEDDEAIRQLMENTMITDYRLNSTRYYLKDARIQSFQGSVTLSIHGPEPMTRLFDMLLGALQYTGLGVKTSLGMGGVTI